MIIRDTGFVGALWPLLARSGYSEQNAFFFNNPMVTICVTGNALTLKKKILCKFGQIYATGNSLMQLKVILCKFGQICATGNVPMLLETRSVEQEMLLCSWKLFYASSDKSVRQEISSVQ